ncbi:phage BR0599 family protein [bacterium]|nr:phage BR0599 family protein [bacterium]
MWDLYGAGCGVKRAQLTHLGKVKQGSTRLRIEGYQAPGQSGANFDTRVAGYFNEGVLEMLSGDNVYVRRGIRAHTGGGILELTQPLPYEPAVRDIFRAVPGCDKTWETCGSRFANQARYRGFPYLPTPDSIT